MASKLDDLLIDNMEWVEDMLLFAVANNHELFDKFSSTLCVAVDNAADVRKLKDKDQRRFHNDFQKFILNPIYYAIRDYNDEILKLMRNYAGMDFQPITPLVLERMLKNYAAAGKFITGNEVGLCVEHFKGIQATMSSEANHSMALMLYPLWLKKSRMRAMARAMSGEEEDESPGGGGIDATMQRLVVLNEQLDVMLAPATAGKTRFAFGEGYNTPRPIQKSYSTGFPKLDRVLGGGLVMGQSTLMVAASSTGKTVAATQLCYHLCKQGLRGVLISTEQKHWELEPRFASMVCGIPFDDVKNNFNPKVDIKPEKAAEWLKLETLLKERLVIHNWIDEGANITKRLPAVLEELESEGFFVDFVILDWIGGGLGAIDPGASDALRLIFKETADFMAVKLPNKITISFAQAHPSKGYNRLRVGQDSMGECKTMGQLMYNIIGITGLTEKIDEKNITEADLFKPTFTKEQYFFVEKARGGRPQAVKVHREFHFQRFAEAG